MKMRKLVAVLVAVLMLCCVIPFSATADGKSATIDFTDKANRVSYSTEQQVWAQNGITVTNDKAASTSNVGDYGGEGFPVRFYKSSAVKVEYTGMTKIVFNCDDYKASYSTDLQASVSGATATVNGTVVTVTFDAPVNSFVIAELVAQVRVDSIIVYTGEGGDAPIVPDEPEVPSEDPEADTELSIADAIALGLSKEHNVYTSGKYFVTGVITEVYNDMYGNMRLTDDAGNILTIYGTYSDDGEIRYDALDVKPVAGDTVTIYGIVGQYNGTPQIKNGWIVEHIAGENPDDPDEPIDPPVGETLTIAEAIALGLSKEHNVYTSDKYYVTGVITEVYNTQYGNMKLTDEDGNILTIYGTYSADGELRYDAMDVKPVAGDTVTIYGIVGQYNGTPQIKNGWIVEHIPAGGETPDDPDEPIDPPVGETLTIAEAIALGLSKEHNVYTSDKYYVTGVITEVYNTQYGNMKLTDADGNILTIYGTYSADGELRYDAMDVKPVAGDTVTVYGIVGQYNGTPQIKNGWIVEHIPAGGETPDEPDEPDQPEIPDEPVKPVAPSVDTAFKFGMAQGNLDNQMYYLAGGMDGFYMATTTDISAAIDVYLEAAEGGFYFYTIENGAKKYINMVVSADGLHVNGAYEDAASTVYTYDAVAQTLVAEVDGASYWFATRNDKQYTTLGPCKVDYEGFYGKFYTAGGKPVEPDSPDTGDNSVVYITLAVILVMLSAAAVVVTSKKRA